MSTPLIADDEDQLLRDCEHSGPYLKPTGTLVRAMVERTPAVEAAQPPECLWPRCTCPVRRCARSTGRP